MDRIPSNDISRKRRYTDQLVVGFALFSMFFGAGNIIFPPYLGMGSGSDWIIGFICYYLADIGIAVLAIFALIRNDGEISNITGRIGKVAGEVMLSVTILCIGPMIAVPRTGATVHEMFVVPTFGEISPIVSTSVFFLLVLLFSIKQSSVVDIIGKILTPALVIGLLILIIAGIVSPLGDFSAEPQMENVVVEGINSGYQTMDVLAAMIFGIIIVKSVMSKGYTETKMKYRVTKNSSLIASLALLVIYCGLTYLGATVSGYFDLSVNRSTLILTITEGLMGHVGVIILGIIVMLACLTTAVALISAASDYFNTLSKGKLDYRLLAIVMCVISALIANFGLDMIISLASPVLSLVYPGVLTIIILSLFKDRIPDAACKGALIGALIGSFCEILFGFGVPFSFVISMPFYNFGFGWVAWAVVLGVAGAVIGHTRSKKSAQ